MIRCTWYFASGRESNTHDMETAAEAFERLQRTGMTAHVFELIGAGYGPLYIWRPDAENTFEAFCSKLGVAA